ncbi:MAG: 50S ribosomal protein L23 [Candidatus Wildermuthbacteria bacterium]|nr:50S ribosomal protein L23 [Candidatus Wildermuthbacteria bacterium]
MAFKLFKKEKEALRKPAPKEAQKKEAAQAPVPGNFAGSFGVIQHPLMTEKALQGAERRSYTFKVYPGVTKHAVRQAVQDMYKVNVSRVNMITMPEKSVRVGKTRGVKQGFKKAIVILKKGQKIDIAP